MGADESTADPAVLGAALLAVVVVEPASASAEPAVGRGGGRSSEPDLGDRGRVVDRGEDAAMAKRRTSYAGWSYLGRNTSTSPSASRAGGDVRATFAKQTNESEHVGTTKRFQSDRELREQVDSTESS